jgi:hypothetical protein
MQAATTYTVECVDGRGRSRRLASELSRGSAVDLALRESRNRGLGRMFLAGSERHSVRQAILIVSSATRGPQERDAAPPTLRHR